MTTPNAKRLLFVDDEEGVRVSWSRYFSEKGFDVATSPNSRHALDSLAERPADVVVSDYRMPGADGLQLLEQVREQHPETPFIILTGYGSEDLASEALKKGAFAYLRKPVDPETLTGMLTSALEFRVHRETGLRGVVDRADMEAEAVRSALAAMPMPTTALPASARVMTAPAQAVTALAADLLAETAAAGAAVQTRARVIEGLKIAGSMVLAPIIGLAFVIFFPVIGFAALFKVVGEAIWEMFQRARAKTPREA